MRVALLFFGQPRYLDDERPYLQYRKWILDRYDTDVYVHTWFDKTLQSYDVSSWTNIGSCPVLPDSIERIESLYSPKVLVHEPPQTFQFDEHVSDYIDKKFTDKTDRWTLKNYSNLLSQLKSIQSVARLYQDTHDMIVLSRFDCIIDIFPSNLSNLNKDKLYVSDIHNHFPDIINCLGSKHLDWIRNVYDDTSFVYKNVMEPSPEAFKAMSFLSRFNSGDICSIPMSSWPIRR